MSSSNHLTPAQSEALQARFALRVTARLEDGTRALPHDIGERLRIARQQAVAAAAQARLGALAAPATATAGAVTITTPELALAGAGSAGQAGGFSTPTFGRHQGQHRNDPRRLDDGPTPWIWRLASALPVIALVGGLWGVGDWTRHEQVQAAADVDTALLTDDLPPSAYADPGFEEYLKTDEPQATESAAMKEAEQASAEDLAPAVSSDTTGSMPREAAAMPSPTAP